MSGTRNNKVISKATLSQLLSMLEPSLTSDRSRLAYDRRIWSGLEQVSQLADDNLGNKKALNELYHLLSRALKANPTIAKDCPACWEAVGLALCSSIPAGVNIFPSIEKERKEWSLLDYLQNEIIQFCYFSGEKSKEKHALARQAINFLLEHRNDVDSKLIKAVENEKTIDSVLLNNLKLIIAYYSQNPSKTGTPPRDSKRFFDVISGIPLKLQKEHGMITVGPKPGGASPGRLKVKRICATKGKESEADKYLNLWLEKDLGQYVNGVTYTEPVGGSIAKAVYGSAPKARLLEKRNGLFSHSSINKFQHDLIMARVIPIQPNFNPNDEPGKLLGFPVVGLIGLLITSSWVLKNTSDLNLDNFGVIPGNNKIQFFLLDFDITTPWDGSEDSNDKLLAALNQGDMDLLKRTLKSYISNHIPDCEQESALIPVLNNLIDHYDANAILQELNDLIANKRIFTNSKVEKPILTPEQTVSIQHRLDLLKTAIENYALHSVIMLRNK